MSIGDKKDDISLIQSAAQGDKKAQKKIYDIHSPTMYAICLRYLKDENDAQDALQNGYMNVFKNLSKFKFKGSFEGWMKRIFVNSSIEFIRKRKLHLEISDVEEYKLPKLSVNMESTIDYETMLGIVNQLPTGYRTVFNMYVVDGFNHQEIAQELGITESTSKTQLFKARKQLQTWMSDLFSERRPKE